MIVIASRRPWVRLAEVVSTGSTGLVAAMADGSRSQPARSMPGGDTRSCRRGVGARHGTLSAYEQSMTAKVNLSVTVGPVTDEVPRCGTACASRWVYHAAVGGRVGGQFCGAGPRSVRLSPHGARAGISLSFAPYAQCVACNGCVHWV